MMSLLACQRASPSGPGARGGQRSIALRFIAMSISMYSLVVVMLTCPTGQDLITLSSAPDWSRCRAVVWRLCGIPHKRHSAAMALLHSGVDISVIALWLGHESSETSMIYLHADMSLKERALARITPPTTTPGRYTAPNTVLAFLDSL